MKIAISSTGKTLSDKLDSRFGRCDYFIIYDLDKEEFKAINNNGVTSSQGAGIAAAQQIVDENVNVVISGHLGPNAFRIIDGDEIKIYEAQEDTIENILKDYKENKLKAIEQSGPAHAGMK